MLLASAGFGAMGLLVKLVSPRIPAAEIAMWRSLGTAVVLTGIALRQGLASIRPVNVPMHIVRAVLGMCSMIFYFNAIARLQVGEAVLLTYLSPLLVAVLSPVTVGERPPRRVWAALCVGIGGVALVVGPAWSDDKLGVMLALAAALSAASAYLSIRVLTRTDAPTAIVWWFSVLGTAISSVSALDGLAPLDGSLVGALLAIGVLGAAAQSSLARAYASAPAAQVSVYAYATPVFAYLGGLVALGEVPSASSALGAALVVVAGLLAR